MSKFPQVFHGVLHGQSIELDRLPSLPDGSKVDVIVSQVKLSNADRSHKLRELFGGCAEDADELDKYVEWNRQQRQVSRRGSDS